MSNWQINRAAAKLLGRGRSRLIGRRIGTFISTADRPVFTTMLRQVFTTRRKQSCEVSLRKADDQTFRVQILAVPCGEGRECHALLEDITARTRAEHSLRERVKELNCLHRISKLVQSPGMSLDELLQEAVQLIPPAWQYPEMAVARIVVEGRVFQSRGFRKTPWMQAREISVHGQPAGRLEVGYRKKRPALQEGPFLAEERRLLNLVAEQLGRIIERIRTAEALAISEERHRSVLEDQTEVICRLRVDGTFLFVNDVYCRFFGKPAGELIGKKWQPIAVPEDVPQIEAELRTLSPSHPVVVIENRVFSSPGQVRWMQFVNRGFFDADGRLREIQSVGRDITERKQAEEALRQNEAKFRAIFNALTEGVVLLNAQGQVTEVNDAVERLHGHTLHELTGAKLDPRWRIIRPDGTPFPVEEQPAMVALRTGQAVRNVEMGVPASDGKLRWRIVNAQPVFDDRNAPTGAVVSFFDITERKQAEAALRESEARLRLAAEAANVGMWDWDLQTNTVYFSPEWKRQIGFQDEEISNRYDEWESRLHPDDLQPTLARLRAFLAKPDRRYEIEFRFRHKDGSYRWIYTLADVLLDATARPARMLGCHIDITQRKATEAALRHVEAQRLAEQRVAAERTRIARDLHDDLGNRLSEIQILAERLASSGAVSAGEAAVCQRLRERAVTAVEVLDGLVWLMNPRHNTWSELVGRVERETADYLESAGIEYEFTATQPVAEPVDSAIEHSVLMALRELLHNAAIHGRPRRIKVSAAQHDDAVTLQVEDDGRGFDVPFALAQGRGLANLATRAGEHAGALQLQSKQGQTVARVGFRSEPKRAEGNDQSAT